MQRADSPDSFTNGRTADSPYLQKLVWNIFFSIMTYLYSDIIVQSKVSSFIVLGDWAYV